MESIKILYSYHVKNRSQCFVSLEEFKKSVLTSSYIIASYDFVFFQVASNPKNAPLFNKKLYNSENYVIHNHYEDYLLNGSSIIYHSSLINSVLGQGDFKTHFVRLYKRPSMEPFAYNILIS